MAYLAMMAPRLVELHRVLKETGSLYLHCDPTASAYLRTILDNLFGAENLRNEIVWQRTPSKGLMSRRLARNHDLILSYQQSNAATWNENAVFQPYDLDALDEKTKASIRTATRMGASINSTISSIQTPTGQTSPMNSWALRAFGVGPKRECKRLTNKVW